MSPRCHPELAWQGIHVEYCWGAAKLYYRRHNDCKPANMHPNVVASLKSVTLAQARKFARRARSYRHALADPQKDSFKLIDSRWLGLCVLGTECQPHQLRLRLRIAVPSALGRCECEALPGAGDGYVHQATALATDRRTAVCEANSAVGLHSLRTPLPEPGAHAAAPGQR